VNWTWTPEDKHCGARFHSGPAEGYAAPVASPRIGIPLSLDAEGTLRRGRRTLYLDAAYADAVSAAGGSPRPLTQPADPGAVVAEIDGVLVPGGDDFLPGSPYPAGVTFRPVAPAQLSFDLALMRAAQAAGLPILGICYGMQLLVLARGGRLHHHLPHDLPRAADHGGTGRNVRHRVTIEPDSRLGVLLGTERATVDSRHHQAVADPGDLHVSARAEDGVIEAVESADPSAPFALGVQWHPETMDGEHAASLFGALVAASARRKR
jgi:putative glutamine amidotransferase